MREATLNGLSDLDAVRPRKSRAPAAKPAASGKAKPVRPTFGARFRRFRSRATLVVASAGFSAIMVGIVCNAVLFQKGHHPAPLFGSAVAGDGAVAAPRPVPRLDAAPPPPAPAPSPVQAVTPEAAPAVTPAPAHHVVHAAVAPHRADGDGIARLLGQDKADGAAVPAHRAPAAPVRKAVQVAATAAKPKVRPGMTAVARTAAPAQAGARTIKPASALAAKDRATTGSAAN